MPFTFCQESVNHFPIFHVWQLTGVLSYLGILQQLLLSLLVKLWVVKTPLVQSLLLAGLSSVSKSSRVKYICF